MLSSTVLEKYTGKGVVFNIQRFMLHNGPGIRTVVFLKGCPLRCQWCSHPEGLVRYNQVLYDQSKCKRCGTCLRCPDNAVYEDADGFFQTRPEKCNGCGKCEMLCLYGARGMTNRLITPQEIVDICLRDNAFSSQPQGGLTLSGGDPLGQPEFTKDILILARQNGLSTAMETSGFAFQEHFLNVVNLCDTVHADLKAMDDQTHKKLTGQSNKIILENIQAYDERTQNANGLMTLRIPLIKGHNATLDLVCQAGEFIKSLRGKYHVELRPFHNLNEGRYTQLGLPYALAHRDSMHIQEVRPFLDLLSNMRLSVSIMGY